MKRLFPDIMPLLVALVAAWVIIIIPFKIIGYGFLPPDDALWHSAKVISGKNWGEVLVLRDSIKMESHPGWHAILGFVHKITKWDAHSLVLFSVISLFILFAAIPIFFFRYPESWLLSLLVISIAEPGWLLRLFLGRPYILTMAVLLIMFLVWPKLKDRKIPYPALIALTIVIAVSTWAHRTFYILLIPIMAFLLAREWRATVYMAVCSLAGIFIGTAFTGHPVLFIKQTILHLFLVAGSYQSQDMLVGELRPSFGDFNIVIVILAMLFWRALRGGWKRSAVDNPLFILIGLSFVGAFITRRIWLDVGIPMVALWIANEFQDFFATKINNTSPRRLLLTIVLAAALYISFTSDAGSRWSGCRPIDTLSSADPEQAEWLPGPGGIIYSDDMDVFFKTVFRNPHGNWRYILGSEAAIMPQDDLVILRSIQKNRWTYLSFEPWVKKMRQEDRLIIRGDEDHKPKIPELEWKYAAFGTWVGRKPKNPGPS